MAWAFGAVLDDPSGNGIPYALLYNYIDGYWSADVNGQWGTPNAFPGMDLTASALGHDPQTVPLYNDWTTIRLDRIPPSDGDTDGDGGW